MNKIFDQMGIYLNQPQNEVPKIIYNQKDAAKRDKNKILKVNKYNIKFGKSKNFNTRHREYQEIFGENTNFKKVVFIDDYEKLILFEVHLKHIFEKYCLRSLANGVQMEWMEKITLHDAEKIIIEEYEKFLSGKKIHSKE